jgi:hypothetical protein
MHWQTYGRLRARGLAEDRRAMEAFQSFLMRPVMVIEGEALKVEPKD